MIPGDAPPVDLEQVEVELLRSSSHTAPDSVRQALGLEWRPIGSGMAVAASRMDVLMYNAVIGLGVTAPAVEAELDAAIAFYRAAGSPRFMIQLAPTARPAEVTAWLEARGFYRHNHWIKLWRSCAIPVPGDPDPRVREIGPEHAAALARSSAEVFGLPPALEPWTAARVGAPGWRHYAAFDGADPVGFGALFTSGSVGWLGVASTQPSHRRQGIQTAIIAARLREARRQGLAAVVVETADDTAEKPNPSTHNLVRMGFEEAYRRPNWVLKFPAPPAP